MTDAKKTERLHLLISPNELEKIDTWRFKNRIGTRADAVRRLCQIGLAFHDEAETLQKRSERAMKAMLLTFDKMSQADQKKLPKGIRGSLAVALEEQSAALKAASAAYIAALVFSQSRQPDESGPVENLMQQAATLISILKESKS